MGDQLPPAARLPGRRFRQYGLPVAGSCEWLLRPDAAYRCAVEPGVFPVGGHRGVLRYEMVEPAAVELWVAVQLPARPRPLWRRGTQPFRVCAAGESAATVGEQ